MSSGLPRKRHHPRAKAFYENFARQVRVARFEKGLLGDQVAKMADINRSTLTNIERGHSWPDLVLVARLCDILNIKELTF